MWAWRRTDAASLLSRGGRAAVRAFEAELRFAALTADGARVLAALVAEGHLAQLEYLDLCENRELGDAGTAAIAEAMATGRLTRLEKLWLDGTGMGDAGAAALGAALGGAPALKKLVVGENAFGAAAAEGLKAACKARGVAAMAMFFYAL